MPEKSFNQNAYSGHEYMQTGAEPCWFMVSVIAMSSSWPDCVTEAYQQKIHDVLKYLSRSEEDYKQDVYNACNDLNAYAGG